VVMECNCNPGDASCEGEETVDGEVHCGGIALRKGGCVVPTSGTFSNIDAAEVRQEAGSARKRARVPRPNRLVSQG